MGKVQHRSAKKIYGFRNLRYEERLERLNLFLLQYKRLRGDMIETYKIISGRDNVSSSVFARSSMDNEQRMATKMVFGFENLKYEERLERVNLFLLQYRRMRGDMIKTYKIISGLEDVNSSQFC